MARFALFLSSLLFLSACAEIIPLTGGKKDTFAPKPLAGKQIPEQGALGVNTQLFSVTFDEYFKLQEPTTTVTMNPSVGKLTTVQKNKTLTVSWEEPLLANTTYILQLNGTVRDVNENNDSILRFVFSTGLTIDSLALNGTTVNAFTNGFIGGVTVGLYTVGADPYTTPAVYAARTDNKGLFDFSYLKTGNYDVFAFVDQNKNQAVDKNEVIGFLQDSIAAGDSLPMTIRLFQPPNALEKLQVKLEKPGTAIVSGRTLEADQLYINGFASEWMQQFRADSIRVSLPIDEGGNYTFVYQKDTIIRNLTLKDRKANFVIQNAGGSTNWRIGDTLKFNVNENHITIDPTKITLLTGGSPQKFDLLQQHHQLQLIPRTITEGDFRVHFDRGALFTLQNTNDSISFQFKTYTASDLSDLTLDATVLKGHWLIQLMDGEKIVAEAHKQESENKVLFKHMIPGQYSIRCIEDTNKNAQWDLGSYTEHRQAEKVVRFSLKQKLRANWEIEEVLKID